MLIASLARMVRALSLDVALLRRRRDFGLLTAGEVVSQVGSMMTFVALPVQCYAQTHSTLLVGLLGAVEFVPILCLALVGGAMADGFDRRRLLLGAEAATMLVSIALIVNASLAAPTTWFRASEAINMSSPSYVKPGRADDVVPVRRGGAGCGVRGAAPTAARLADPAPGRARRTG
jgi:MFS family permease